MVYFKLTADSLDDFDAFGHGHVARFPSAQNPVDFFAAAWPIAVAFVALERVAAAHVIERLRNFS